MVYPVPPPPTQELRFLDSSSLLEQVKSDRGSRSPFDFTVFQEATTASTRDFTFVTQFVPVSMHQSSPKQPGQGQKISSTCAGQGCEACGAGDVPKSRYAALVIDLSPYTNKTTNVVVKQTARIFLCAGVSVEALMALQQKSYEEGTIKSPSLIGVRLRATRASKASAPQAPRVGSSFDVVRKDDKPVIYARQDVEEMFLRLCTENRIDGASGGLIGVLQCALMPNQQNLRVIANRVGGSTPRQAVASGLVAGTPLTPVAADGAIGTDDDIPF